MRNLRLVTTFFHNRQYYEKDFIEWYSKHFDCNEFIFFIGEEGEVETNTHLLGYPFKREQWESEGITYTYLTYRYTAGTPDQWHSQKQILWAILRDCFDDKPTLVCDCDEFIYCQDIDGALERKSLKTHFYEHMPSLHHSFSLSENCKWNEQGWYFRNKQPSSKGIHHGACKAFYFNKREFVHMGDDNNYCKQTQNALALDEYESVCFHASLTSLSQYLDPHNYNLTSKWNLHRENFSEDLTKEFKEVILNDFGYRTFNLKLSSLLK